MHMLRIKAGFDIMSALKASGYSSYRIAQERLFGQGALTKFRRGGLPSWGELDRLCFLLRCGPWDIVEYVDDADAATQEGRHAPQEGPQPAHNRPTE